MANNISDAAATTTINELPDVILLHIFSMVTDTRSRNSLALVCRKFMALERATRYSLTLRGNARDLFLIPNCFRSVTHLDLSVLSPWGHSLLSSPSSDPHLLAYRLKVAFPAVTSLTVYSRSPSTLQYLLPQWPRLRRLKLIRWHQRSQTDIGDDFIPIFEHCQSLEYLDLSSFYYWTEDLPPVLQAYPAVSASLTHLDLLTASLSEGFKANEISDIARACPNLNKFLVACIFDPRYIGFVGDETLMAIASNCQKLSVLHLVDTSSLSKVRGNPESEQLTSEEARITGATLVEFFSSLPLLEELVLDVAKNVRESGFALEALNSKCKKLRVLKLGQFHGICSASEWQLAGVALCGNLKSLSIKNSWDLTDMGLVAIGRGCCKLAKFEVEGCKMITVNGLRTMASLLRNTLVEVKISCCKNLDASSSLRAVEPIRDRIQRLHIDCVWDGLKEGGEVGQSSYDGIKDGDWSNKNKRSKYALDEDCSYVHRNGNGFWCKRWDKLSYLSLWINVGDLLAPLPMAGLENCPVLAEICIKVEGDCKDRHKPSEPAFGLSCLVRYPMLSKMKLDCGDTIGYALTAPSGQMDLSLWERFILRGIKNLSLNELHYWPPQDRDVNQRSLSLPAAGLLAECLTLRTLFIYGTAHEHFMMFLLRITNLRNVQLREEYYPAPDNDMSTEMRVESCSRFEDALNMRQIPD